MKLSASGIFSAVPLLLLLGSTPPLKPLKTMCRPSEIPLFYCPIGRRIVSVCNVGSKASYRFGLPGQVQVEVPDGRVATRGFSGGGETQIAFEREGYRYVVYDRLVRTTFGEDGRHDPEQSSGILVLKGSTIMSDLRCSASGNHTIDGSRATTLPQGRFIER